MRNEIEASNEKNIRDRLKEIILEKNKTTVSAKAPAKVSFDSIKDDVERLKIESLWKDTTAYTDMLYKHGIDPVANTLPKKTSMTTAEENEYFQKMAVEGVVSKQTLAERYGLEPDVINQAKQAIVRNNTNSVTSIPEAQEQFRTAMENIISNWKGLEPTSVYTPVTVSAPVQPIPEPPKTVVRPSNRKIEL